MPVYFCYANPFYIQLCRVQRTSACGLWIYFFWQALKRQNVEITISYFLIRHEFPIPTLFISSSFSMVQTQSVLLIYFGMNRKFWSWFHSAHSSRKYTITSKYETEDPNCTIRGLQLSEHWTESADKFVFFFFSFSLRFKVSQTLHLQQAENVCIYQYSVALI